MAHDAALRHASVARQLLDGVGSKRLPDLLRRHRRVGAIAHPGLRCRAVSVLLEGLQQLPESTDDAAATQHAADAATGRSRTSGASQHATQGSEPSASATGFRRHDGHQGRHERSSAAA